MKEKTRSDELRAGRSNVGQRRMRNNNVLLNSAQARVLFALSHGHLPAEEDRWARLPIDVLKLGWYRTERFDQFIAVNNIMIMEAHNG